MKNKILAFFLTLTFPIWAIPYAFLKPAAEGFMGMYRDLLWLLENRK
jgi:hypothetical protein